MFTYDKFKSKFKDFNQSPPFPHCVIDNFFHADLALQLSSEFPDFDENQTATLFYTTGTTGNPKGVSYSHRQLVLHTLGLLAGFGAWPGNTGLHRRDVYMPLTPLFHVHGWGFPYAATMLGLSQVYPGKFEPDRILQLIADKGVTFSHCVPTVLSMVLDHPKCSQTDLSSWKVIVGGASLPRG